MNEFAVKNIIKDLQLLSKLSYYTIYSKQTLYNYGHANKYYAIGKKIIIITLHWSTDKLTWASKTYLYILL